MVATFPSNNFGWFTIPAQPGVVGGRINEAESDDATVVGRKSKYGANSAEMLMLYATAVEPIAWLTVIEHPNIFPASPVVVFHATFHVRMGCTTVNVTLWEVSLNIIVPLLYVNLLVTTSWVAFTFREEGVTTPTIAITT